MPVLCMENTGENVYCVWKFKDYFLKCRPMDFTSDSPRYASTGRKGVGSTNPEKQRIADVLKQQNQPHQHLPTFSLFVF